MSNHSSKVRKHSEEPSTPILNILEPIVIPPSADLIADEYVHQDNADGLVIIFHSKLDEANLKTICKELQDQNYVISEDNLYRITTKEFVLTTLNTSKLSYSILISFSWLET